MIRLALLALALTTGCSQDASPQTANASTASAPQPAAPAPAPAEQPAASASDKTLLFFLNPNGRPCQMQDQIIKDMGTDLTSRVNVQYVSINDPSSRDVMGNYGIRALPTLIVVDGSGAELHRFPAGIREADAILAALN